MFLHAAGPAATLVPAVNGLALTKPRRVAPYTPRRCTGEWDIIITSMANIQTLSHILYLRSKVGMLLCAGQRTECHTFTMAYHGQARTALRGAANRLAAAAAAVAAASIHHGLPRASPYNLPHHTYCTKLSRMTAWLEQKNGRDLTLGMREQIITEWVICLTNCGPGIFMTSNALKECVHHTKENYCSA